MSRSLDPLLAIETSTPVTRVVVLDGETGKVRAADEAISERHSSNLLRLCVSALEQAALAVGDLGAVACGAGPGSFTGLRVGLAVAKGLALPRNLPLLAVSSLEALALDLCAASADGAWVLPCIDGGKGQVFAALFERVGSNDVIARSPDWSVLPSALPAQLPSANGASQVIWGGPGGQKYRDVLTASLGADARFVDVPGPTAHSIGRRAFERLARGERDDLASVVPSYGRAPDITRPKSAVPQG